MGLGKHVCGEDEEEIARLIDEATGGIMKAISSGDLPQCLSKDVKHRRYRRGCTYVMLQMRFELICICAHAYAFGDWPKHICI